MNGAQCKYEDDGLLNFFQGHFNWFTLINIHTSTILTKLWRQAQAPKI